MAVVREFGLSPPDTSYPVQIPIPALIPVGHTLILAAVSFTWDLGYPEPAISDTQGNPWLIVGHEPSTAGNWSYQPTLASTIVANELSPGDFILVNWNQNAPPSRSAFSIVEWDEKLNAVGTTDLQATGSAGTSVESGVLSTPNPGYVISTVTLQNAGREPSGINGTTVETKHTSINSGVGHRAVFVQHKPVSGLTTQTQATLSSQGTYAVLSSVFETAQEEVHKVFEWDGSVETPLTGPYYWDGTTEQPLTVEFAP